MKYNGRTSSKTVDGRIQTWVHQNSRKISLDSTTFPNFVITFRNVYILKLSELSINPPEGIIAGPISEENFFEWEALISGPVDTVFEGGLFPAKLVFPTDYPLNPPKMSFLCEMFHPNIFPDGRVCISILHSPGDDPLGYESSSERWSPVQSVEKILLASRPCITAYNY